MSPIKRQEGYVPPPFGGTYFGNGPTTYTVNVPFQFGQPLAFSIESKAHFQGFDDPGGFGSSFITLEQLSVTGDVGQPVAFNLQSQSGADFRSLVVPEPSPFALTTLGLGLAALLVGRKYGRTDGEGSQAGRAKFSRLL